ncbi:MAG: M20/M25/M40 family metallo-hydrolase, partial [Acidobacteria bacterium]|nr:M20/M25/M40 family metallo-hydrolase [Acidobacteriota bacterium]
MSDLNDDESRASRQGLASTLLMAALTLLVLIVAGWGSIRAFQHPVTVLPADAPGELFSAGRSLAELEWIAEAPRPMGSERHRQVRERLADQLKTDGLEVETQSATVLKTPPWGGATRAGAVKNIVARLPGGGRQPALMLMAHYDSVPNSPGAGDDGSGVAAVLEVVRALQAGGPLEHELLVLLTDGEEAGLLGARAFVQEHPWAREVGVALNMDARGASGPVVMFRTGEANAWLVKAFAEAVEAPRASSLGYEVFRILPNDTDLSEVVDAGLSGLDFAFVGDHPRYHSARDSVRNLSPESLQHMGDQVLALLQHLDGLELSDLPPGKAVYFNLAGNVLVRYPASWALPLALVLAVAWLVVAFLAVRRGLARPAADLKAAGGVLAALLIAAGVSFLAWQQAAHLDSDFGGLPRALSYEASAYGGAFVLLAAAAAGFILLPMVRSLGGVDVVLGSSLWMALLSLATAVLLPGASYVFLLPGASGVALLTLLLVVDRLKGESAAEGGWTVWILGLLAAVTTVLVWSPLVFLLLEALGLPLAWAAMPLVAFAFGISAAALQPVARIGALWIPALCGLLGVGLLVSAVRTHSYDEAHPRADNLFYCVDPGKGIAHWASADPAPAPWMVPVLGENPAAGYLEWCQPTRRRATYLKAEAPVLELPGPTIELLRRETGVDGVFRIAVAVR